MQQIEVPYIPGDRVWTMRGECVKQQTKEICEDCGHVHWHDAEFIKVPVLARVEDVTVTERGWYCNVGWHTDHASYKNHRGSHEIWDSEEAVLEYIKSRFPTNKENDKC